MDELRVRTMSEEEVQTLERWARSRKGAVRLAERARLLLWARQGCRVSDLVRMLGLSDPTVRLWIKRFNVHGLEGLKDAPRSGRPPTYTPEQVAEVLARGTDRPQDARATVRQLDTGPLGQLPARAARHRHQAQSHR